MYHPFQAILMSAMSPCKWSCAGIGCDFRGAFNTFLDYNPRGGVIADGTGLGKTAVMIGLILSEPERQDLGASCLPSCAAPATVACYHSQPNCPLFRWNFLLY